MEYLKVLNDIVNKYYKRFPLPTNSFFNDNEYDYAYLEINYSKFKDFKDFKNRLLCLVFPAKLKYIFIDKKEIKNSLSQSIIKPKKLNEKLFGKIEVHILEYWISVNNIKNYNIHVPDSIGYVLDDIPVYCRYGDDIHENFVILEPKDNKEVNAADIEGSEGNDGGFSIFDEPKTCNNIPSVEGKSTCKENNTSLLPSLITKLENIINRRKAIVSEINQLSEELDKVDSQLKKVGEII